MGIKKTLVTCFHSSQQGIVSLIVSNLLTLAHPKLTIQLASSPGHTCVVPWWWGLGTRLTIQHVTFSLYNHLILVVDIWVLLQQSLDSLDMPIHSSYLQWNTAMLYIIHSHPRVCANDIMHLSICQLDISSSFDQ